MIKKTMLLLLCALYIAYHLITLDISPLVWYDETVINSITIDFINNGTLYSSTDPIYTKGQEAIVYGPVFFAFNGFIINILGNGIWQGRLLGLIAGLFILFYTYYKHRTAIHNHPVIAVVFISFILDPFFNASLHKGRYDSLGVLFYLLSFEFLILYFDNKKIQLLFFSAIFFSACSLISMRFIPFGFPLGCALLIYLFQSKKSLFEIFKLAFFWAIIPVVGYLSWIIYKFGNLKNFISYFEKIKDANSDHLIGNLFIPIEVKPLVFLSLLVLVVTIIKLKYKVFDAITFSYVIYILIFYTVVGDVGPYSIIVIPVFYLLLIRLLTLFQSEAFSNTFSILKYMTYGLFIIHTLLFAFKFLTLSITSNQRNHKHITEFVRLHVPPGSKILGEPKYYYAAIVNQCEFQYANPVGFISDSYNIETIEKYRRIEFDYDYILASFDMLSDKRYDKVLSQYQQHAQLVYIDSLKVPTSSFVKPFSNIIKGYNFSENGYNGILYKRVK